MDKSGRSVLVHSFLCAMPIHTMMALDVPADVLVSITNICRAFMGCLSGGHKSRKGGIGRALVEGYWAKSRIQRVSRVLDSLGASFFSIPV